MERTTPLYICAIITTDFSGSIENINKLIEKEPYNYREDFDYICITTCENIPLCKNHWKIIKVDEPIIDLCNNTLFIQGNIFEFSNTPNIVFVKDPKYINDQLYDGISFFLEHNIDLLFYESTVNTFATVVDLLAGKDNTAVRTIIYKIFNRLNNDKFSQDIPIISGNTFMIKKTGETMRLYEKYKSYMISFLYKCKNIFSKNDINVLVYYILTYVLLKYNDKPYRNINYAICKIIPE